MKAAVTDGHGNLWIDENVPIPQPDAYQCLCKTNACSTCTGTDLKIINGTLLYVSKYPAILGHESVGTVVECGKNVRNINPGDRYLRCSAIYQGDKLGDFYSGFGGFAEYSLITDRVAFKEDNPDAHLNPGTVLEQKIPECISDIDATIVITLKEAASYVAAMNIKLNQSLLLIGTGSVGISMLRFAKIFGAYPVIVAGRRDEALEHTKLIGADATINTKKENISEKVKEFTQNKGVDFILDTSGSISLLESSLICLSSTGKVAAYATYPDGGKEAVYEVKSQSFSAGNRFLGFGPNEALAHNYIIDALRLSLLNPADFYAKVMAFDNIAEGFERLKRKELFKIVFKL